MAEKEIKRVLSMEEREGVMGGVVEYADGTQEWRPARVTVEGHVKRAATGEVEDVHIDSASVNITGA